MDEGEILKGITARYVVVQQPPYPFPINDEQLPLPKLLKQAYSQDSNDRPRVNKDLPKRNRYRPTLETQNFPDGSIINFNLAKRRDGSLTSGKISCHENGVKHPNLAINWIFRRYDGLEEYALVIRQYKLNGRGNNSSDGEVVIPFNYSRNLRRKRVGNKYPYPNGYMSRINPDEAFAFFRKSPDEPETFETSYLFLDGADDIFVGPERSIPLSSSNYVFVHLNKRKFRSLPTFRFRLLIGRPTPILQISSFPNDPARFDVAINWAVEFKYSPEAVFSMIKSRSSRHRN